MAGVSVKEIGKDKLDRVNAVLRGIGNGSGAIRAVASAMKRAADSGKTQAGRYAAETYRISKGAFMARCSISSRVSGGSAGASSVEVVFAGSVIPLIQFGNTKGGPQGGVTVGPKGASASLRSAFINAVYGQRGVWERVGIKRFPVEQKYGPSTGHMMQDEGVSEKLTEHMIDVFDKRIEVEISRILNGG